MSRRLKMHRIKFYPIWISTYRPTSALVRIVRDIREEQTKHHEQLIQIILKYDKFNKNKYQFYRHPDARLGMGFLETNWDQLSR